MKCVCRMNGRKSFNCKYEYTVMERKEKKMSFVFFMSFAKHFSAFHAATMIDRYGYIQLVTRNEYKHKICL